MATRGCIVLIADRGQNNAQITRALGIVVDRVRLLRQHWLGLQPILLSNLSIEENLQNLPRLEYVAQITANQIRGIATLACELPVARTAR
jgi:hypothetical protein